MSWEAWVILGWWVLNCLLYVGLVGRPRKPIGSDEAVVAVVTYVFLGWLLLRLGGVL